MIVANETVASHIYYQDLPSIYRVHDKPNQEKIQSFLNFLSLRGYVVTGKNKIDIGVGSFYLNVLDNISNYKLKLNKGIGTIKVNDEEIKNDTTIGAGDNIINISGGVGSINIDFKE